MMTRKDYVSTAEILDNFIGDMPIKYEEECYALAEKFADMFEADNPRFSRSIFIDACYNHQEGH
jgi:hypothetical protein